VAVVIAAEGYPEAPAKGDTIILAERAGVEGAGTAVSSAGADGAGGAAHAYVLQAGTALDAGGELVSAGGRVLNVVGAGADVAAARAAAYELAGTVEMRGGWYRRDIAAGC
jgi:phosphoribosylamine--glycine ligase